MSRIITHADLAEVPDGGVLQIGAEDRLTPLAAERAAARGIAVQRGGAGLDPGTEAVVQAVAQRVFERLGQGTGDPQLVQQVVAEVLGAVSGPAGDAQGPSAADYCAAYIEQERARARRRAVITTTGRNQKGIVARVTAVIAELGGDILDISQTLVGDYFTMILVVDTAGLTSSFMDFKAAIEEVGRSIGFQTLVMHEDVVTSLSRV